MIKKVKVISYLDYNDLITRKRESLGLNLVEVQNEKNKFKIEGVELNNYLLVSDSEAEKFILKALKEKKKNGR